MVWMDIGIGLAEGGEQAGGGRHDDPAQAQRTRHAAGEEWAVAAEGEEREFARIAATLGRYRLDGADHVRGGDQMGAIRGLFDRHAERPGDLVLEGPARLGRV